MKKTVNINVSGIIFHIDEDAYTKLNAYLESLKSHFHSMEGSSDIIDDIEARIAELLQERLSQTKQVISIQDVNEVILVMGQPSQFAEEETPEEEAPATENGRTTKRFYRDPDNKIVAGVCGGIGAYLHWDPVIIRILFIISLFAGGFGAFLYLILWVVIPEATTTTEKLEMRGERVNISNIEKSIHEEVSALKDQLKNLTQSTKQNFQRGSASFTPIEQILKGGIEVLKVFGRILLIILGVTLVLIGISFFIALLAFIFGWGGTIFVDSDIAILAFPDIMNLFIGCTMNPFYIQLALLILLGIPVILLLYSGIRMIFKLDGVRYFGVSAFNIWLIGLVICVFFAFKVYNHFKAEDKFHQQKEVIQPLSDTLYLKYEENAAIEELQLDEYEVFDGTTLSRDYDGNYYLIPIIRIMTGYSNRIEVNTTIEARGRTTSEAKKNTRNVNYPIRQSVDTLLFPSIAALEEEECWSGEQITVTVRVPVGQCLILGAGDWRYQHEYYYDRFRNYREQSYILTDTGLEEIY
ncbi:MAG: PspC domain-containing protein [Bacteroidia bacterium]|nr:PspC domain-containing protein [Bacteroidia bacterium]